MIVFQKFSLASIVWMLTSKGRYKISRCKRVFYIEISLPAEFIISKIRSLLSFQIEKLEVHLKDIKDEHGELERLKLTREHLFKFPSDARQNGGGEVKAI